jgi:hypothetical protein
MHYTRKRYNFLVVERGNDSPKESKSETCECGRDARGKAEYERQSHKEQELVKRQRNMVWWFQILLEVYWREDMPACVDDVGAGI